MGDHHCQDPVEKSGASHIHQLISNRDYLLASAVVRPKSCHDTRDAAAGHVESGKVGMLAEKPFGHLLCHCACLEGRIVPGEPRQREFAYRAGVNIVMYTLTGNYKADQVHIPALLERLGQ